MRIFEKTKCDVLPAVIIGISVGASVVAVFAVLAGIEQYAI